MSDYFIESRSMIKKLEYGNKRLLTMIEDLGILYQYMIPWPEEAKEGLNEAFQGLEYGAKRLNDLSIMLKKEIS